MTHSVVTAIDVSGGYDAFHADFRWVTPAQFNFGADVVDRLAREADGPALIWENASGETRSYRFSDIARESNRLANVLARCGIKKGDFVLIMLPRIPEWQIAMVAALKLGAIPIPCIEMLTARDIAYRMTNSGARAVICRASEVGKFGDPNDTVVARIAFGEASGWLNFEAETGAASPDFAPARVAAEDPAIMFYTSGSTGHPKGVLHASRALHAWWVSAAYWLDLNRDDLIWCTADTGWSKAGTSILFGPWSRGACAFFYDGPFDAKQRLRLLAKHGVTIYCAAATELLRVADEDVRAYDLSRLRRTVSAGEAVSPVVAERWRRVASMPISEAYGQTETLMTVLNYPGEAVKPGSMGRPAPGSKITIVDHAGRELPDGEEGDIAMSPDNPQLMLGYWKDPERTEACFMKGPSGRVYVTGDRGLRDEDGYIWYRGRSDDIINSSGYRIGPMEVENVLLDHPAVRECAVVGKPDPSRGEIVKAFVVLRESYLGDDALIKDLQNHCRRQTAAYKYPREISFIEELPKTLTGKVKRSALRKPDASPMSGSVA